MKVIFMGTPDFACPTLERLMESDNEILAVYTQPPKQANRGMKIFKSKIHQLAEKNDLHIETAQSLKSKEEQDKFKNFHADIAIVAAYGLLLPKEILEGTKYGCINIHPSKLPRWRGAAPIQRTLMAGDKVTAVCIMQMDEGLDTGNILQEKDFDIDSSITAGELHDMLANEGAELTIKVLDRFKEGKVNSKHQSHEGVTYAKKLSKEDEKIDFNKVAHSVHDQIRALSPYPGAFFELEGVKYKVLKSEFLNENFKSEPGTIINKDMHIACKTGVIKVLIIQKEGKKPLTIKDFLNGNKITVGAKVN